MRKLIPAALGLYLAAAGVAQGQEGPTQKAAEPGRPAVPAMSANQRLATAIAERLRANANLKHYRVDLAVADGVAELTGQVKDQAQRDEVMRTVQAVPGVQRVRDHLTMAQGGNAPTTPITMAPAQARADKSPAQASATPVQIAPLQTAMPLTGAAPAQAATPPAQVAPLQAVTSPNDIAPAQVGAPPAQLAPFQFVAPQAETAPPQIAAPQAQFAPMPMLAPQTQFGPMPMLAPQTQFAPMPMMVPQVPWMPVQAAVPPMGVGPRGPMPPEPLPIYSAQPGMPNPHLQPPPLPPNAWPTYAPYNNYSRVAYPTQYPYEAWPFIGPVYPFPKVPLGWRAVTLRWQDGYWWYGREASGHDWWRIRYW